MASSRKTDAKDPEKTVDVPPYGSRNPDPITDAPGSHPVETGVGAAVGGAASGFAVGMAAGPVGAVVGTVIGAVAGGYAGKGVGELVDPTTEDNWIREYFGSEKNKAAGATEDTYRPAYRYGLESSTRHAGKRFEDVESHLRTDWEKSHAASAGLGWDQARGAVRHAFDRTIQLREEQLHVDKHRERTGEVNVRKEVITEQKQITVPVEREEVVIERRPAHGAATGDIKAEEIRIPVSEERVDVHKETVVKEEVTVGKRKVTDTQTVADSVKREELRVEETGDVRVKGNAKKTDNR